MAPGLKCVKHAPADVLAAPALPCAPVAKKQATAPERAAPLPEAACGRPPLSSWLLMMLITANLARQSQTTALELQHSRHISSMAKYAALASP